MLRPAAVADDLRRAAQTVAARQGDLRDAHVRLAHWQAEHERTAGVRGLTPNRRRQHRAAGRCLEDQAGAVARETVRLGTARADHDELLCRQAERVAFDRANQWRQDRIDSLDRQLRRYWAGAVLEAAKDGYPAAYGSGRLRVARQTIIDQIEGIAEGTAPGEQHQPRAAANDPVQTLADLDRSIEQAAGRPGVPLIEAVQPRPQRTDPWPDAHPQHVAYQQLHNEAPSLGIEL